MKLLVISLSTILLFLLFGIALFYVSKSRNFQFFGEIIHNFHTTDKVVALTFDDGPQPFYTEKILRILSQEQIKATFYLIGKDISNNLESAKSIVQAGHDIGNHTYSHKRMVFKSWDFIQNEIDKTDKMIRLIGYTREITFRTPNCKKIFLLPYYLKKTNRKTITWNIEPESVKSQDSLSMIQYTLKHITPGSIILMHGMNKTRDASINALPEMIRELKKSGYSFLTISELLNRYDTD